MYSVLSLVLVVLLSVQIIFPLGRRTSENPKADHPSTFMTVSDYLQKKSPKERKENKLQEAGPSRCLSPHLKECNDNGEGTDEEMETNAGYSVSVPMQFIQQTRELEVRVYTGLSSPKTFQFFFDYLSEKAQSMQYWRGGKQTTKETPQPSAPFELATGFAKGRLGPERKLRLEQKFLLTLMKLRLALLTVELGFRFYVSPTTVSSIFITWIKLSIVFAASARQLWQTQESSPSAVIMVRSAHGKCHQVLQVSQQIVTGESLISKITLLHFGQSKMSLYPNRHGNTNDL